MRSVNFLLLLAAAPLLAQPKTRFITWPEVERRVMDERVAGRAAELNAGAARAAALGSKASRYPSLQAHFTSAAAPPDGTRLGAGTGSLNNPIIFPRTAYGVTVSQLITDFGRSSHLAQAASQRALAEQQTAGQLLIQARLSARQAYLALWRAQALEALAQEALAQEELEPARAAGRVAAEAALQLTLARNDRLTATIDLASLLGEADLMTLYGVPAHLDTEPSTQDAATLIATALRQHPEVEQRRRHWKAAEEQVEAERAGRWPVVTGLATLGYAPVHSARFGRSDFTVVGMTIGLPLPLTAAHRAKLTEAQLRAEAARASLTEMEARVARNVSLALVAANSASARLSLARLRQQHSADERDQAAARVQVVQAQHELATQQALLHYYAAQSPR